MENFLTQFTNEMKEVTQINSEVNVSPEFYGSINVAKGLLTMSVEFYARVYQVYNKETNMFRLDDWDAHTIRNINFNGIVVDDLNKLTKSMEDSGLSTLATNIKITDDDLKVQIAKAIEGCALFKSIFGKKATMVDSLPEIEQKKLRLEWLIANYHNAGIELNEFYIEAVKPTKEDLMKILKSL
jgi:hypothetical protein